MVAVILEIRVTLKKVTNFLSEHFCCCEELKSGMVTEQVGRMVPF